ncbi:MAG: extracellular solute-binding protein [Planctomycetota bacterium]
MNTPLTRVSLAALLALCALALARCAPSPADDDQQTVVLYSSVDSAILREVVRAFEADTGLRVLVQDDTEATKTTGLVVRLLAERDDPRADVWWSSEPFGTEQLADAGALAPYTSEAAESYAGGAWPAGARDPDARWYGLAVRSRVFVYSPSRVDTPPTTLRELTAEPWRGRVGMARPAFGTTRGHMAWLSERWGEDELRAWGEAMRANDLRLYDGNATVVRKVAEGEIDIALTDTDDVLVGLRNGWDVAMAFEAVEDPASPGAERWTSPGPMSIATTVGLVEGSRRAEAGKILIDWLLTGNAERLLAQSENGHRPVIDAAAARPDWPGAPAALVSPDIDAAAEAMPGAIEAISQALGEG